MHHPLTVIFYIKLKAIHDFLSLLVALEIAAEALGGRCMTDLLSLEVAHPWTSTNLANILHVYYTTSLTIQQGADGGHGGFRTTVATTTRLLEGIACGCTAISHVAAMW